MRVKAMAISFLLSVSAVAQAPELPLAFFEYLGAMVESDGEWVDAMAMDSDLLAEEDGPGGVPEPVHGSGPVDVGPPGEQMHEVPEVPTAEEGP